MLPSEAGFVIDRASLPNSNADDTPDEQRAIDARIAVAEDEIKNGQAFGPFVSHNDFLGALHTEAAKLDKKLDKKGNQAPRQMRFAFTPHFPRRESGRP